MSTRTSLDSLAAQLHSNTEPDLFYVLQRYYLAEETGDELVMRECAHQLTMIEYLNTGCDHDSTIPEPGGSQA